MMVTGYNLTEPEYSRDFPLVQIDILLPQIFNSRSALVTDGLISHVYYNPDTDDSLPKKLISERNANQTMEALNSVITIDKIRQQALDIEGELVRPSLGAFAADQTASSLVANLQETDISERTQLFQFDIVCMGGTFDHMHLGHRLLLTQACLVTNKTLHIGVTGDALLTKKAYAEHIEPYEERCRIVREFLERLAPHIEAKFFELSDPVGIAG